MSNINALLSERLNQNRPSAKMAKMAQASASGNLTSFSGIFSISDLSDREKEILESILYEYTQGKQNSEEDLLALIQLTSEVKAINNQAIILHGERIKKAHALLANYREGAFSAWLLAAYGNRQTPYNFMQYYDLHVQLPKKLHAVIESMPRQAIYTLASREGAFAKKLELIQSYQGQTKAELLAMIRAQFPLPPSDQRQADVKENFFKEIRRLGNLLNNPQLTLTKGEKKIVKKLFEDFLLQIDNLHLKPKVQQ